MTPKRVELAKQRQALPMVAIEKNYMLITESGEKSRAELFEGDSQRLI